jgi:hypothetical protein
MKTAPMPKVKKVKKIKKVKKLAMPKGMPVKGKMPMMKGGM